MGTDQTLRVIDEIRRKLNTRPVLSRPPFDRPASRWSAKVLMVFGLEQCFIGAGAHIRWMLDEMEGWIKEPGTMDMKKWIKLQRWLGFVQGALWLLGVYSIDDMRKQNASTSEVPSEGAPGS